MYIFNHCQASLDILYSKFISIYVYCFLPKFIVLALMFLLEILFHSHIFFPDFSVIFIFFICSALFTIKYFTSLQLKILLFLIVFSWTLNTDWPPYEVNSFYIYTSRLLLHIHYILLIVIYIVVTFCSLF